MWYQWYDFKFGADYESEWCRPRWVRGSGFDGFGHVDGDYAKLVKMYKYPDQDSWVKASILVMPIYIVELVLLFMTMKTTADIDDTCCSSNRAKAVGWSAGKMLLAWTTVFYFFAALFQVFTLYICFKHYDDIKDDSDDDVNLKEIELDVNVDYDYEEEIQLILWAKENEIDQIENFLSSNNNPEADNHRQKVYNRSYSFNSHNHKVSYASPLCHAAKCGNLEICKKFCEHNWDLVNKDKNEAIKYHRQNALYYATKGKHEDIERYLIDHHGYDYSTMDSYV